VSTPIQQMLMSRFLASRGLAPETNLQEAALGQLDPNDPTTAVLAQLMASRTAAGEQVDPIEESVEEELEELRLRNQTLASALGACPICWGEDDACPKCAGKGRPGSLTPDEALFAALVTPAIRRRRRVQDRQSINQ
jgi:hypothetical protein